MKAENEDRKGPGKAKSALIQSLVQGVAQLSRKITADLVFSTRSREMKQYLSKVAYIL